MKKFYKTFKHQTFLLLAGLGVLMSACTTVELSEEAIAFLENYRIERQAEIEVSSGFEGRIGRDDYEIVIFEISHDITLEEKNEAELEDFAKQLAEDFFPLIKNRNKFNRAKVIIHLQDDRQTIEFDM